MFIISYSTVFKTMNSPLVVVLMCKHVLYHVLLQCLNTCTSWSWPFNVTLFVVLTQKCLWTQETGQGTGWTKWLPENKSFRITSLISWHTHGNILHVCLYLFKFTNTGNNDIYHMLGNIGLCARLVILESFYMHCSSCLMLDCSS